MTGGSYPREDCSASGGCGGNDLKLAVALAPSPVRDHHVAAEQLNQKQPVYPLDVSLRRTCGYTGLADLVNQEAMFVDSTEVTPVSLGRVEHMRNFTEQVLEYTGPPPLLWTLAATTARC